MQQVVKAASPFWLYNEWHQVFSHFHYPFFNLQILVDMAKGVKSDQTALKQSGQGLAFFRKLQFLNIYRKLSFLNYVY